jgi:phosphoadenosine phosphosulfate reductase
MQEYERSDLMSKLLVKDEIARPLDEKLKIAYEVIDKHFLEFKTEECFVAWSGGKDSTFLLYLVIQKAPNIRVVFTNTGVELPQTLNFVKYLTREWNLNFIELHPEISFWECVKKWGYPSPSRFKTGNKKTGTPQCCFHLKEKPVIKFIKAANMKACFIGTTAWESWGRRISAGKFGFCHHSNFYGVCRVKPILFFRPDEIWYLTKKWNLPVNEAYTILPRVGCMPCTGHIGWEAQLARISPKLYEFIQRQKGGEFQLPLRGS